MVPRRPYSTTNPQSNARVVPQRVYSTTSGSNPKKIKHDDSHLSLRKRKLKFLWKGSIASHERSDLDDRM
ncbi:hypothetical protein MA16_Dca004764 [Dendrobium catenatum]|uniref:Uncharacterized protein n=1 Tax=Dendrobium catenatum TaxID=906689 RepID=A0A2I0VP11_9ASPA|nr:hypothetical protein MA16_Dca004764 [Dendrobium catenatum]